MTLQDERSVVFICGDHGMSDQGSHGGSSPSETLTPFVFLSPLYEKQQGSTLSRLCQVQFHQEKLCFKCLLNFCILSHSVAVLVLSSQFKLTYGH